MFLVIWQPNMSTYLKDLIFVAGQNSETVYFLTRELRACARASYRYDVGNTIRSLDWSIPVNFF